MQTARIPDYLVDPGEKIIHTLGCREDGTYLESAMIITQHYLYVVGNLSIREDGIRPFNTKGFKVIDLASVKDIDEITTRYSFLIILSLVLTLILILFSAGYSYKFPVNPVPSFVYEILVFTCAAGSFISYILMRKNNIKINYKGGEIQFRNRIHIQGALKKARELISRQINHNILIKN